MAQDYIPQKDADFNNWLVNLDAILSVSYAAYGLTLGNSTDITTATNTWSAAYTAATDPVTRTPVTITAKDNARAAAESLVRPFCMQINLNPSVSDAQRTTIGITVRKTTPSPIATPTDVPGVVLKFLTPGGIKLAYVNTTLGDQKAKPPGSKGVELWATVGTEVATDPSQASYKGTVTKSPFSMTFGPADVGKTLSLWIRYTTAGGTGGKNLVGPWSARFTSAII